jgi:hypothetical protein
LSPGFPTLGFVPRDSIHAEEQCCGSGSVSGLDPDSMESPEPDPYQDSFEIMDPDPDKINTCESSTGSGTLLIYIRLIMCLCRLPGWA